MRTINIFTEEDQKPMERFVSVILCQALRDNASEIRFVLEDDQFRIYLDRDETKPPPKNLFEPMVKQALKCAGKKVWPWTKSVKGKRCCISYENETTEWSMSSEDISKQLTITRI